MYGPRHLYYEDMEVGQSWQSPAREITEQDVRVFAELTRDFNPIHVDPEYAATTPFGRTIAHGMLTLGIASGQAIEHPPVRTIAVIELTHVRFTAAVYPGDKVHVKTTVVAKERRGRGKRGHITWKRELFNQDGKLVQEGSSVTLVEAREAVKSPPSPAGLR